MFFALQYSRLCQRSTLVNVPLVRVVKTQFSKSSHDDAVFKDPGFREATRLMEVKLQLVSPDRLRFPSDTNELEGPVSCPTLHFIGTSAGAHGTESTIEGYVRLETHGHIYWHFVRMCPPWLVVVRFNYSVGNVNWRCSAMELVWGSNWRRKQRRRNYWCLDHNGSRSRYAFSFRIFSYSHSGTLADPVGK